MSDKKYRNIGREPSIDKETANDLFPQLENGIAKMKPEEPKELKEICDSAYWAQLGEGLQRHIGIVVSHLVDAGLLPLVKVEQKHEYPLRYIRVY